jgi:hypothetical protein
MNRKVKDFLIHQTPIGFARALYNFRIKSNSQSDENAILLRLTSRISHPKTFVEFGFHAHEFNCAGLARTYSGLLIDGDERSVVLAKKVLPSSVEAVAQFLTLDSLNIIEERFPAATLGVLSIDVDGNDYWFLERLINLRPAIISVEYNASFGQRPISVVYDPAFIRHDKHKSGWYHGASLSAMAHLCSNHSYDLAAVDEAGVNAFFVRRDLWDPAMPKLSPENAYREHKFRNQWSGKIAEEQWQAIRDLPYVNVDTAADTHSH